MKKTLIATGDIDSDSNYDFILIGRYCSDQIRSDRHNNRKWSELTRSLRQPPIKYNCEDQHRQGRSWTMSAKREEGSQQVILFDSLAGSGET